MKKFATHKAIKRSKLKKKLFLGLAVGLFTVCTAASADMMFVTGGHVVLYSDWFNPNISHTTGHCNAIIINRTHSTWVSVGNTYGSSRLTGANSWAYATAVGAWNGKLNGWYKTY